MFKDTLPPFWHIRKKAKPPEVSSVTQTLAELDPELAYDDTHPTMTSPDYRKEKKTVLEPPDVFWVAKLHELCDSR